MKICLDTNVIIDILGKTADFLYSYAAFDVSLLRKFEIFMAITSTTDIAYIMPRRNLSADEKPEQLLAKLFSIVEILDARAVDARQALQSEMTDYEDALIAQMALRNGIDLILTRNLRDFEKSPVPVMSPEQFVSIYKPENVNYNNLM